MISLLRSVLYPGDWLFVVFIAAACSGTYWAAVGALQAVASTCGQ